ncbi:thioredoxin [Roseobacter sp. HKCCD9010]|uniref:zinc-ribbon domain-containing protein n=1 Tax=unclassified Roseobacter TaxID=196798 RepID=UPI00149285C4|nr:MULTISPECIES: zinc-ribbon domain-containing protein [unclassified Roseobacter]MBF9050886.1 thioredoxin [Rhodobacterales bacterium HKCCD4356]NNV12655.1 thioredoxin [Roseobacter sp. HKCCD7357]NNV16599.1 thioredoxin [Roseobacter sp. HKCCD8768]NNV26769.1 thioredoxin [Roseobacter sp. HKCCD8192]NNV30318.1 thioredoxin [Roseobacter sp. HKCCD9061]
MRLTCPNCSARYEVDDEMIPPEGRDVQCSNCSTTWFQPGARSAIDDEVEANAEAETEVQAAQFDTEGSESTQEADPTETSATEPEDADNAALDDGPARRDLDPAVRNLLREEAERETRLRREEAEIVETQDEMALDSAPPTSTPPEADTPPQRQLPEADENFDEEILDELISGGQAAGPRRDLLPDIEEINSTLRATSDRNANEQEASDVETVDGAPRRRRGARLGFALVLFITAALVAIYSNAVQIAERVPQASPALQAYVTQVNAARLWLDDLAQGVLQDDESASGDTPPSE